MKTKIECIVTDLDCTLLNAGSEISREDLAELLRLRKAGVRVIVATGRHPSYASKYFDQLGLDGPVICGNGGLIYDPARREILKLWRMEPALRTAVVKELERLGIPFSLHAARRIYMTDDHPRRRILAEYSAAMGQRLEELVGRLSEVDAAENELIYKISAYSEQTQALKECLYRLPETAALKMAAAGQNILDITGREVSKGTALRYLSGTLHFSLENTLVFGDNENDSSLFQTAGHQSAVGNAIEELKAAAEFVTHTNEESGVSFALKTYYRTMLP